MGAMNRTINNTMWNTRDFTEPWFESWSLKNDFGAIHPIYIHNKIEAIGSRIFVAMVSKKSKRVSPAIVMCPKLPCDKEHKELNRNRGAITIIHAFNLDILNRSCINAIETSAIEIVEVNAATIKNRKNNIDHS